MKKERTCIAIGWSRVGPPWAGPGRGGVGVHWRSLASRAVVGRRGPHLWHCVRRVQSLVTMRACKSRTPAGLHTKCQFVSVQCSLCACSTRLVLCSHSYLLGAWT
jgi:hypothetical protein